MRKPLIAISAAHQSRKGRVPDYEANETYIKAVLSAGGLPVVLPTNIPEADWLQLIDAFGGFLYCGGGDVNPERYGAQLPPNSYGIHAERDHFELGMLRLILEADKPLLCICRGLQVLNVGLGGTLIGDIAAELPEADRHDWYPSFARDKLVHTVTIKPGSKLERITGRGSLRTNSLHHQAVKKVGDGLVVTARAADGVIEAAELPDKRFVMGVQWHPEHLQDDPAMRSLFENFIKAAL
ncbi:MAG TPA: gamma-glutamyl-gamma-aminobutyrate hydrolase family protein [Anaerolineaceae bacterium]|nr:gamma-glutamyl-gamma-aminobutyrate hydrolase family protein [Chloroflexota bacterium]HNY84143.1 gamma-glutamyl-gamma-aminobutyrate hydrolase family protein [Anaerolineaceae bacterium]